MGLNLYIGIGALKKLFKFVCILCMNTTVWVIQNMWYWFNYLNICVNRKTYIRYQYTVFIRKNIAFCVYKRTENVNVIWHRWTRKCSPVSPKKTFARENNKSAIASNDQGLFLQIVIMTIKPYWLVKT